MIPAQKWVSELSGASAVLCRCYVVPSNLKSETRSTRYIEDFSTRSKYDINTIPNSVDNVISGGGMDTLLAKRQLPRRLFLLTEVKRYSNSYSNSTNLLISIHPTLLLSIRYPKIIHSICNNATKNIALYHIVPARGMDTLLSGRSRSRDDSSLWPRRSDSQHYYIRYDIQHQYSGYSIHNFSG